MYAVCFGCNDITLEFHCFDWVKLNIQYHFDQFDGNMNIKVIIKVQYKQGV